MKHSLFAAMLAIVLTFAFSATTFAQDAAMKEMKKDAKAEMKKEGHKMMSVSCDPACGFMVKSHDEKELVAIVKSHAKMHHNKDVTDKDVMGMMMTDDMKEMKHEMKKK